MPIAWPKSDHSPPYARLIANIECELGNLVVSSNRNKTEDENRFGPLGSGPALSLWPIVGRTSRQRQFGLPFTMSKAAYTSAACMT
jgi:hypothetical protein